MPGSSAAASKVITNGAFNVPVSLPPPASRGVVRGTMSALIDGGQWNAAADAFAQRVPGSNVIGLADKDTDGRVIHLVVAAGAPGTYSLGYLSGSLATLHSGANTWSTGFHGSTGNVTITTLTRDRISGSFTVTLPPSPANVTVRPAVITDGRFDLNF